MKKKLFYGWVIVFACMVLSGAATGLLAYMNPLYVAPVSEGLGVSRAAYMMIVTFFTAATVVSMPVFSTLSHKIPMKVMIFMGVILGAGSQLLYSVCNNIGLFYLGGILGGIATCLCGAIPIAALTSNWFHEKKGLATGLALSGSGICSALMSPVVARIIEAYGWRTAYRLTAALIVALIVPVTVLLIRPTPQSMGLLPYGVKPENSQAAEKQGPGRKEILKMPAFWVLCLAMFLLGAVTGPAQQQLVAYWSESGNTAAFAATLYSLLMTVAIFTKIFLGSLYDKAGVTRGTLAVAAVSIASYVCLVVFPNGWAAAIGAVLFGATLAVQTLVSTYVNNRLFGDKEYAFTYGIMNPMLYGGVAVGSPVVAAIYDGFGSYAPVFWICAGLFGLAAGLVVLCQRMVKASKK